MKMLQKKTEEILATSNPNEAYLRLALDGDIPLDAGEKILRLYEEKYNVTSTEMTFYPNGKRELQPMEK